MTIPKYTMSDFRQQDNLIWRSYKGNGRICHIATVYNKTKNAVYLPFHLPYPIDRLTVYNGYDND